VTRAPECAILDVWVQPGASRRRIAGMMGDALKVAVSAPPEKGKANKAVERLLAEALGLPRSSVQVIAGASSRRKKVRLKGVGRERLDELLANSAQ